MRTLDEILEQAFTDGQSDTMWVADRHVEIFATAKAEIQALITEARIDEVQNILNIRTPTNGTTTIKKKAENRLTQLKKDLSKS